MKKKLFFVLILISGLVFFGELGSYLLLRFLAYRPIGAAVFIVRRPTEKPLGELIREQTQSDLFDRELGWSRHQASTNIQDSITYTFLEDGSRLSGTQTGPVSVSFYGCSITMGLEVNDDESFPAYFSERSGVTVKNWGVPGYGPDQSLLKFERELQSGKPHPPIAVLGFGSEGINRNMSAWRIFYTGENLLKPRLMMEDGRLIPHNPILAHPEDYFEKSDKEILRDLAPYDYWLTSSVGKHVIIKPTVEFSYCVSLARSALYLFGKASSELAHPERPHQSAFNLNDQKMPLDLMCEIIDRFYRDCDKHGIRGYVVIITEKFFADAAMGYLDSDTLKLKKGRPRKLDENLSQYLEDSKRPYVDTLPGLLEVYRKEGTIDSLFRPYLHPAPRMNEMIADALLRKMREEGAPLPSIHSAGGK